MKVSDARKLIGKRVEWDEVSPRYRWVRSGVLMEVRGRNLLIDGDYKWLPRMTNLRLAQDQQP